jgi:hypothetical protein
VITRIVDNAHLLDATEIFRKLNVHKKVRHTPHELLKIVGAVANSRANPGIIHQARLPPRHVFLLPLLDDRCSY